ncbi:MAG TPA: creatininase family protein, partial [Firmicutes bacterium]|nr:creatininase family protein [Bacillota bacterium]
MCSDKPKVLYLPELTWLEVKAALPDIKAAIIPVGSTEQHGPHGTFQTDFAAAREFSLLLGKELYPNALVTTPVPIGISEHHIRFPGTLSLRASTFIDVLMDIAVSLKKHGIKR